MVKKTNKRKYTKTNAPTITKISHNMRGQDIMEEDMKSMISTPSGKKWGDKESYILW